MVRMTNATSAATPAKKPAVRKPAAAKTTAKTLAAKPAAKKAPAKAIAAKAPAKASAAKAAVATEVASTDGAACALPVAAAAEGPKKRYKMLTGIDDSSFCQKVSDHLDDGYELYGSPAATFNGINVIVAQAVVLKKLPKKGKHKH